MSSAFTGHDPGVRGATRERIDRAGVDRDPRSSFGRRVERVVSSRRNERYVTVAVPIDEIGKERLNGRPTIGQDQTTLEVRCGQVGLDEPSNDGPIVA